MKEIIYYFANGLFYPSNEEYKEIPEGAIAVSAENFFKAMNRKPGETFTVDDEGNVDIVPVPPITSEQIVAQAEHQRGVLRATADAEIAWRQDAVDADIATDEETAALAEWKKYRVLLMRVDTTTAPEITWPEQPK